MVTAHDIKAVLLNSISMDERTRRLAFQHSVELQEKEPRLLPLVLNIYSDSTADRQLRFLAICFAKNIAGRLYPKITDTFVREHVKSVLLEILSQNVEFLKEFVMLLRRVARHEFPNNWPELVSFLQTAPLSDQNAYVIYQLVKEQETKKMMAGRNESLEISPILLQRLAPIWLSTGRSTEQTDSMRYLDGAVLRLCRIGFLRFYEHEMAKSVISFAIEKFVRLVENQNRDPKFVNKLMKEIALLYEAQMLAFTYFGIDKFLRICLACIKGKQGREFPINILTHTFNSTIAKRGNLESQSDDLKWISAASACRNQFRGFVNSGTSVHDIVEVVIDRSLRLNRGDVVEWLSEPDESIGGPLDGYEMRSAGELFIVSVGVGSEWSESLIKLALNKIENQIQNSAPDLLEMDSYVALLILCNVSVHEFFDFNTIVNPLIPVLQVDTADPCTLLLQFRVIQLIRVGAVKGVPPSIMELLCRCLDKRKPLVIRLTAINGLKSIYDRTSDLPVWEPLRAPIITTGIELLRSVSAIDVVWRLLNIVTLIATNSSETVDIAESNLSVISNLFMQSDDLVKYAIFDLLKSLLARSNSNIHLIHISVGVVELTFRTVGQNISAESAESVVDAAAGLLSALIRVVSVEYVIDLRNHVDRLTEVATALVSEEVFSCAVMECLIDWNCSIIVKRPDLIHSIPISNQIALVSAYLKADIAENIADETLILLEVIVSLAPEDNAVLSTVGDMVQFIASTPLVDDDACPLPIDGVVDVICSIAKSAPEQFLRMISSPSTMIENLLLRSKSSRQNLRRFRILSVISLVLPYFVKAGGDPRLYDHVAQLIGETETALQTDSLKCSGKALESRFDSSNGAPLAVSRESVLAQIRRIQ